MRVFSVGAARAWAEKEYGGPLAEIESTPTVQNAATLIAGGNGDRVGLIIMNIGTQNIFVGLRASFVVLQAGILLPANAGVLAMNVRDDGTLPSREWWASSILGGPSAVQILELVRVSLPLQQEVSQQ
jgi:hypothetical protein